MATPSSQAKETLAAAETIEQTSTPSSTLEIQESPNDVETSTPRSKLRIAAILTSIYVLLFIAALDQTVVATAIPTISSDLKSGAGYTWIGGAYLLATAATGPIWAKVSDIWGRKLVVLVTVFGFAMGSMIAALAINMSMLIAGRALQGVFAGGAFQLVGIVVADLFSPRDRALYFGLMGGVWAVAGSAGPLIGGALTERVSWRWCFWINLPVCGLSFVLLLFCLNVHNPRTKLREGLAAVDWYGIVTIVAAVVMLLLGLNFGGGVFAWKSATVICLVIIGGLLLGVFLYSEKKLAKYPMMPLGVFRSRSNNAIIAIAFCHSIVSIGVEYYLPLFFQSVRGASPLRSGILILPITCMAAFVDVVGGIWVYRRGAYRELMWAGTIIMTLGTGLYISFGVNTPLARIIGFEILGTTGVALLFQTPTIAIQNTVSQADTASTMASLSFLRSLGTSFSIVIGGVIFQNSMNERRSDLMAAGLSPALLDAFHGDKAAANVGTVGTITSASQRLAVREAYAFGTRNIFIFYTAVAGIAMLASIFIKAKVLRTEHTETKTGVANLSKREKNTDQDIN